MAQDLKFTLRKANPTDAPKIWEILQQAIEKRRIDGSLQWQNGYPNPETIENDIAKGAGFVLENGEETVAYSALIFNDEPAYSSIDGKWLSDGNFLVIHRVAVSEDFRGKGVIKEMFRLFEDYAVKNEVFSIKVDTNFDNNPMLAILEKLHYTYCGKVYVSGGERMAFEKILTK
ncbi:GNAT family N-acetyltransferase [Chryseobacterium sp.]|uniref:GNAT family N-acetyltransferase n=1 Tax=Chryseobacterium sp. TaxID=1871047 RepID=UPI0011C95C33|nr:GNAT family N-acetyltransferase [Chryseobacterium sp.]TXF79506.1 GNAT family N-acetyltransferase [Chryseobacterium sp.]